MSQDRKKYPAEFKRQMVELVRAGQSPESLAKKYDPSANTIRKWTTQADIDDGLRADGLTTAERNELRELRRENRQLKVEREILGKAAARPTRAQPGRVPRRGSPLHFRSLRIREGEPGQLPRRHDVPGVGSVA